MPDMSADVGPAEAVAAPVPPVDDHRLHVVFGAGQVGRVLGAGEVAAVVLTEVGEEDGGGRRRLPLLVH